MAKESIEQEVLRAQVATLYAASGSSTLADTLLAWSVCGIFYWRLSDPLVIVWAGLHFLQLLRYPLLSAYHRDPEAAQRSEFWARRQARELLIYSSVWGLAPWLFMPADNLPMTVIMMLLILGLSSTGVLAVAPRWPSVLSFVLPMVVGLITALLWRADEIHWFLAACGVIYLGATLHFARQQHHLLTQALQLRFENQFMARQLQQQVEVTQHLSAEKTRFFAAAGHDLRQPLHAISLFGAVLEKDLAGRPEQIHAMRLMDSVRALGTSLDAMLDVSLLDAGVVVTDIRPVRLSSVVEQLDQLFASRAEQKGLQLRLRASPLWVMTDRQLLLRLLVNLVENAIKYTTQGGVLVVARVRAEQVWIEVCDTGVGIAADQQEAIFDEFYQINNPGRDRAMGLGIGLSIVRRLSLLLDHPLSVRSRLGRGSRMRLSLPHVPESVAVQHSDQATDPGLSAASPATDLDVLPKRVLLLDDEADIGDAVSALLASHGVRLTVVTDEGEAIEALIQASRSRPFDAWILDYRLAGGADGLAVATRLRQRFDPQLPMLLVTGETAPEQLRRVRDAGIPVLSKPVVAETLLASLRDLKRPA